MKKVWNKETRQWDMVQEGVWLHGHDITNAQDFVRIWQEVYESAQVCASHLRQIFKTLCDRAPLPLYISEAAMLCDVKNELAAIYKRYAHAFQGRKGQGGRDTHIKFFSIPMSHRDGLRNIILGNTEQYHRGSHKSNPLVNSAAYVKNEYLLTASQEGRETSAKFTGSSLIAVYYSLHHAATTYSYHLVTYTYHDDVKMRIGNYPCSVGRWTVY